MIKSWYQRVLIYLLFFLSGSTGLIYEIIWGRKLNLIFGGTVYAVTTILTVFFTGLAIGAILIGRAMDRGWRPVRTYVVLELLLGVFGICSPFIFLGIDAVYFLVQPLVGHHLAGLTTIRFILSFGGLLIPTIVMGATLPVLVKLVAREDDKVASDAGRLYAINTLGAALGTVLASIVLIPLVGVNASLYVAGAMNITIALCAFALFRGQAADVPVATIATAPRHHTSAQKVIVGLFGVVGFISMVYQVAWIRLLMQITGTTVYTFGLMLAVFIVGIGLGSEITTRLLPRVRSPILAFAAVEMIASGFALFSVPYFDQLPYLFTQLALGSEGFSGLIFVKVAMNAIVLFVPTLMFGAAFPLVASTFARASEHSGGDIGLVYSSNTIGGVLGSFVGGFFILPALGMQATIVSMSVLGFVVAAAIALTHEARAPRIAIAAVSIALALGGLAANRTWDPMLINSAPYMLQYHSLDSMERIHEKRLFHYEEGINVNVSVVGDLKPDGIYINGKPVATMLITDMANQYLLGHIPMLLHPDPKSALVVGLGAGMTFGSLTLYGAPVDAVEISPEVVEGTRLFAPYNQAVLDQPNATLIFDDGRNYLKTTRKRYDVITADPLAPFFMGSSYLFDLEHFENAREALNPGGIMCQWLPLYQVNTDEAKIIIKTFNEAFKYVSVWFAFSDVILIGSETPLQVDMASLRRRMSDPKIARELRMVGVDDEYDFLANYLFDEELIPEISEGLPLNTDDYPIIEYMTPRSIMEQTQFPNVEFFLTRRVDQLPGIVDVGTLSPKEFREFTTLMPRHFEARDHVIAAHLKMLTGGRGILNELDRAEAAVAPRSTASHYVADVYSRRGGALRHQGKTEEAIRYLRKALRRHPDSPKILTQLAGVLFESGERTEALSLFAQSLELDGAQIEPRIHLADSLIAARDYSGASDLLEGCLDLDPENASCRIGLRRIESQSIN